MASINAPGSPSWREQRHKQRGVTDERIRILDEIPVAEPHPPIQLPESSFGGSAYRDPSPRITDGRGFLRVTRAKTRIRESNSFTGTSRPTDKITGLTNRLEPRMFRMSQVPSATARGDYRVVDHLNPLFWEMDRLCQVLFLPPRKPPPPDRLLGKAPGQAVGAFGTRKSGRCLYLNSRGCYARRSPTLAFLRDSFAARIAIRFANNPEKSASGLSRLR